MKKTLDSEDYKQCLLFHNKPREVHAVEVNKLALSRNDDKQVIQSNGVSTVAHRHYHGHSNTSNNEPKNLASDILQWSGFGKMNITIRKVDVEKDLV